MKISPLPAYNEIEQERIILSLALGLTAVFVFFLAGSAFEVVGENSRREIVASSLIGAAYLAFCQFWFDPVGSRGRRVKWPVFLAMLAPLASFVTLVFFVEKRSLVPGLPWLLAGGMGSLVGLLLAERFAASACLAAAGIGRSDPLACSRRYLRLAAMLLVVVAGLIALGVLPSLLSDHTPGFNARSVAAFLGITVALNLLAAFRAWAAARSGSRDRLTRVHLALPVFLALLLAFGYAMASGIHSYNAALRTASVLLVICAVLDLVTTVMVTAATVFADRIGPPDEGTAHLY